MTVVNYDVVVIGGGIQGVGVAQAAAAEGQKVLLLEKAGLASGTSSKSSKLIHGGLRYLESAELSLVRECLTERAILLKIAPDLVEMRRFIIPLYKETRRPAWQISTGLKLYYALANFRAQAKPGKLPKSKWDSLDGLTTKNLHHVYYYSDAQTDDRLLTQAVMTSAQTLGAELMMPAEFIKAEIVADGCDVHYVHDGMEQTCHTKVLVNAGGPWVNKIASLISPQPPEFNIDLVGGTHIEVEGSIEQGIYYTESPRDGRAIFMMPWYGRLLVGTTERKFRGKPDNIEPTAVEIKYLLHVLAHYFPAYKSMAPGDVANAWSGLRVLPGGTEHAFKRTREVVYRMDTSNKPSVISIYGGKLTAYRHTAQVVMRKIRPSLERRKQRGRTEELPLHRPD